MAKVSYMIICLFIGFTTLSMGQSLIVKGSTKLLNPTSVPGLDSVLVVKADQSIGLQVLSQLGDFRVSLTGDSLFYGSTWVLVPEISANTYPSVELRIAKGQTPKEILEAGVPIDSLYGKKVAGGLFFYYDPILQMSLLKSEAVFLDRDWGCSGTFIGTLVDSIGSGFENTNEILTACNQTGTAPFLTGNLVFDGFDDWYLPSKSEMDQMKVNLFDKGYGALLGSAQYWMSIEFGMNLADTYIFNSGTRLEAPRGSNQKIIAIRRFFEP